uniref:Peptidase S1 domain-containing protein n=1 Tax=Glossina austeni TaxID=7395 RepID=A0A1A9VTP9_GLOAU
MIIANSPEFEDFGASIYVRYDLTSDIERQKRVQVDKFIKFDRNLIENQHPFILVSTKQNMRMDPRAATPIPITSKEATHAKKCVVIVADRPHKIHIMDIDMCMDQLSDLQEGYICLHYSEPAYKGFALICDDELAGIILPKSTWIPNEPVLYTDLYKRRDWILEHMMGHRPPANDSDNDVLHEAEEGVEERDADPSVQKAEEIIQSKREKNHYRMNKTNSAHNKRDFLQQELFLLYNRTITAGL